MLKSKTGPAPTPAPAEVPRRLHRLRLRRFQRRLPRRFPRRAQDSRAGSCAGPAPVRRQRERHPVAPLGVVRSEAQLQAAKLRLIFDIQH